MGRSLVRRAARSGLTWQACWGFNPAASPRLPPFVSRVRLVQPEERPRIRSEKHRIIEKNALLSGTLRTFQVHACDGAELKIECWPTTVISIYLAQYGRQVGHLCPAPDNATAATTNCLSTQALRTIEESCREQRVCKLRTHPGTFGQDPCPGVSKYAEVAYKCRPNVFSNKVVCEGERLRLRCHRNLRIVIYSAAFGATHYGVPECPQPQGEGHIEDCQVSYATEAVMSSCHGRRKCSVGADVGTFGHPGCPQGTRLFLKVVHTCAPKEILKDLELGGGDDGADDDYAGFVEEPRYAPPPHTPTAPLEERPPKDPPPPKHPAAGVEEGGKEEAQTTVKTDMQSDENSGEQEGNPTSKEGSVVGFLTEWVSAYNFIRENKEKFVLYLTLGLSLALVLILGVMTARFYARRRRSSTSSGPRETASSSKGGPEARGGIGPFDPDPFDPSAGGGSIEVLRFPNSRTSSLRRALDEHEEDDCSFPRAPVRAPHNNYYYS
ncbi:hypothetical protein JTE90_003730 [Oedothorax gibbosus]|uniref:SUEL-type lectin domain-containing protein n=1 Tax=Oedothorax gibbosus TaxID=931172 RepID=A0AAV6VA95_9ARAC|nr:hypothetical protein JTE90_003730 [Oedothorax gibbosus]